VSLNGKLKAAGRDSQEEALVVHSFEVELPAMYDKESTSGVTRDGRALPGVPTFNEWDSGGGLRGANFNLANNLRKTDYVKGKIAMHLDGEAREVARQMLDDSVRFVQELSVWISTHYDEVKSHSGTSEAECWARISHCVFTIFSVLDTARSAGRGQHPNGSKATAMGDIPSSPCHARHAQ
jgi:hypothetical protein